MIEILKGIRVLDLTQYYSGPFCTLLLADLGADVLKIEPPRGDETRRFPPLSDGESAYFHTLNRGKRSRVFDPADPASRAELLKLAAGADVIVENSPKLIAQAGLDYALLTEVNPAVILVSLRASAHTPIPGYDLCVQALSGIMHMTQPGTQPAPLPVPFADGATGLMAAFGIAAALYHRTQTGRGQQLVVPMLETYLSLMEYRVALHANPYFAGARHDEPATPYGVFPAADGHVVIAVGSDQQWQRLVALTGGSLEPWAGLSIQERSAARVELEAALGRWTGARAARQVVALLQGAGIPGAPVLTMDELLASGIVHPDFLVPVEHAFCGQLRLPGLPILFQQEMGAGRRSAAPQLGAHGDVSWEREPVL